MTTLQELRGMGRGELDELFGASPAGEVPRGRWEGGFLLPGPGPVPQLVAAAGGLAWRGKVFADDGATLDNLVTPLGVRAVRAAVRQEPSRRDGLPCTVVDYAPTSAVARWLRDELRQVGPGLYLGLVYLRGRRLPVHFWLRPSDASGASDGTSEPAQAAESGRQTATP